MRISILGAGAIGCYLAARLHASGADVEVIARGDTLDAIRRNGIRIEGQGVVEARVRVTTIEAAAPADVLITCVKAYAISALSGDIERLVKPDGLWLCTVNGVPWWYGEPPLDTVDPGGLIRAKFPIERTAGCVAYLASSVVKPGVVSFNSGKGMIVGMANGSVAPRLEEVARVLTASAVETSVTSDIRSAVWNKLFGNVALNPLTALTGLTTDKLLADPELKALLAEIITEAMVVARLEGVEIESDAARRVAVMGRLGAFRTSMLQDADAGRSLELDGILGAVLELADRRNIDAPASRRLYAITAAYARSRGMMPV
jgi:2-dehydropantoate 2-reductase